MNITETLAELKTKPLSPKHLDVVDSFTKAYAKWGRLTARQEGFLQVIVAEYSAENLRAQAEFRQRFIEDEQYRKEVRIVSEYYLRTGYYRTTARSCLDFLDGREGAELDHPLRVKKMMDNKYAKNVIASTINPPKYEVGQIVQVRSNVSHDNVKGASRLSLRQYAGFMVIEVDSQPISRSLTYNKSSGGTRWYKVLPLGSTDTFEIIERELKRTTKKALGK